ncbi:MAG: DUF6273 domain-containing protein [Coriobacteriales bacterium]|nr:DUF6273 domain-containing protein [Coriobacteriales bacterium]
MGRAKARMRCALACLMTIIQVAGFAPVPLEVPPALAEELGATLVLGEQERSETDEQTDVLVLEDGDKSTSLNPVVQVCGATDEGMPGTTDEDVLGDVLEVEAQSTNLGVSNPRVRTDSSMRAGQVVTWDCVWLGSYPQTEVTSSDTEYASLAKATFDANGDATVGGKRFRRISSTDVHGSWSDGYATYRYFLYEPIKWRVLKVLGSAALVVSDKALDNQVYNENRVQVIWETSGVRSWLNGYGSAYNQPGTDFSTRSFMSTAFSASERTAILQTDVENANNTYYGTAGGSNTTDKVFLLSESEVYNKAHGFVAGCDVEDEARGCKATDYAQVMGTWVSSSSGSEGNCWWWLRSPGGDANGAVLVLYGGSVLRGGGNVNYVPAAIRPSLRIDLASSQIQLAGTASSNEGPNEGVGPTQITSVALGTTSYTYDGKAKKPSVTVKAEGATVPASGYTVVYEGNVNAGTATVTVTGKGEYVGSVTAEFTIKKASVASATVLDVKKKTYDGKAQTQAPTVNVSGRALKKGVDYTLSYKDNVSAGSAIVTVLGKGNYAGTQKVTFAIAKAANPIVAKAVTRTAKLAKTSKGSVTVARPLTISNAKGKVTYVRVATGSSKRLSVDKKTGKVTVAKGTKKGTYKVKIKVAAAGTDNYKRASMILSCRVVVK